MLVHNNVDGLNRARMADPKTKKGKADVKDARASSSLLLSSDDDGVFSLSLSVDDDHNAKPAGGRRTDGDDIADGATSPSLIM